MKAWFRYERSLGRWIPTVHYGEKPKTPKDESARYTAAVEVGPGFLATDGSPMFGRLQAAFPAPGGEG